MLRINSKTELNLELVVGMAINLKINGITHEDGNKNEYWHFDKMKLRMKMDMRRK